MLSVSSRPVIGFADHIGVFAKYIAERRCSVDVVCLGIFSAIIV